MKAPVAPAPELQPLLTIREAATLLHVHVSTMRRWDKTGVIEPLRVGPRGHRRYSRDQIIGLLQGGPARTVEEVRE